VYRKNSKLPGPPPPPANAPGAASPQ
jgi:hypothetical protein